MLPLPSNFRFSNPAYNDKVGLNRFPDGQIQVIAENDTDLERTTLYAGIFTPEDVQILDELATMFNSFRVNIVITYPYGGRSDASRSSDGKYILSDTGNRFAAKWRGHVTVWNPHNDQAWGEKSIVIPIPKAFEFEEYDGIIYPDESSYRRMGKTMKAVFPNASSILCAKKRDADGKIIMHTAPKLDSGKYLMVDDICDGGATFAGVAEQLFDVDKLDLYVTHGLFTNPKNLGLFNKVWTTESTTGFKGRTALELKDQSTRAAWFCSLDVVPYEDLWFFTTQGQLTSS